MLDCITIVHLGKGVFLLVLVLHGFLQNMAFQKEVLLDLLKLNKFVTNFATDC